ncbi:S9 family peptidase, partial [Candidatus Dependentiae bacterium]|nr:S9 family peptidase [Candidatus Dependentiae bacterium]
DLAFSPDSHQLAFIKGPDLGDEDDPVKSFKTIISSTVQIIDLKTKKREAFLMEDLWGIEGWTHDGKKLVGTKQAGTKKKIYEYDIQSKTLTFKDTPNIPVVYGLVLSQNHRYIGFLGESFSRPAEVYVSSLEDFKPKKINAIHNKIDLSQIEAKSLTWKSFDGLEIEGILVYPQNYRAGEKVPLIVSIHGGPAGAESEQFIGRTWFGYSPAVFSSSGYATLFVNYRGSIGYGTKFTKLSYQNLGRGDYQDIMAGVDFLIKEGIADPKQLFITGHSYGGFMTAWAISHTNRFKAAVVKAGISDWISDIALTDAPQFMESLFGSFYWDNYALYRDSSPLNYVNDIKTPTLILHGLYDERVSFSQAQQLYQALKAKKVPTQLFLYLEQEHGISSPSAVIDSLKEQLKWFEKYK